MSTAAGGAMSIRTLQIGFAVEITSEYDDETGYGWKRLELQPPAEEDNPSALIDPTVQATGDNAWSLDGSTVSVGSRVWLEPSPDGVGYLIINGGANKSYYVKLTGFGAGIDGGTAWGGIIQHEDGGGVVNNGYIGADPSTQTFCMYRTLAEDGSAGNPEVGDVVVALPDPSMPGVWLFQPKRGTGPDECGACGWISDLKVTSCLYVYMKGGFGRCSCITSDCFNCDQDPSVACQPTSMVWVETLNGWLSTGMKDTCCGCGGALFQITDADAEEATLTMRAMHVSCETSSGGSTELFSYVLKQECCGTNRCGNRYMLFRGKGTQSCDGDEANCGNEYYVMVECAPCPPLDCSCCCIEESPPAFWQDFPSGTFIGGGNNLLNGMWIWKKDNSDPDQPCKWTADCAPSGKNSVIEKVGTVFRLTHDTFVYELASADWTCSGQNTLNYVSGGSGTTPPVVVIEPILPLDFETETPDPLACTPPDTITVEIVSADCPVLNIVQAITRIGPSSNIWQWLNPDPDGDRVTAIVLTCDNGEWSFSATAVCEGEPSPWEINSPGRPDTSEFDPFELVWDSIDITGLEPSPTPDCCNVGVAMVTITE